MAKIANFEKKHNRHSLDIARDILTIASVKARKTRIMYQANLSFIQVKKYLHTLLEKGLLEHAGDSFYLVTRKGLMFLELYDSYIEKSRQLKEKLNQNKRDKLMLERMCSPHNSDCNIKRT